MRRVDITIKNATKIPLLGVKTQPSPYVIVECEQISYTSQIAKYSQNPIWKYHTLIQAKKVTSYVHFYIYNNNPNAVDQLLAYGKLQFGELMTRTNSQTRLRLMNSLEEPINSFLFVEHYDANPPDLYLPLDDRTCIKLRLINSLPEGGYLICEYGQSSFNLSEDLNENAFRYNPKYDRIKCILKGNSGESSLSYMQNELLIGNIGNNNCLTLRFYESRKDYAVFLSASIILNGLLPENYNILKAKIGDISKSNGKKVANFRVKLYGPLNGSIFNEKAECQIYAENNSQILLEYYQQTDMLEGLQPYCSFKVPLNSLSWSKDNLECSHQLKYYDSFKSLETVINMKLSINKNFELSKIIPKINNPEVLFDENSTLLIQQIRLQNCYLGEVIKNNFVQLFHVDMKGVVTAFNKFVIAQNKTEYVIQTKQSLREGGRGTFYLINLDQHFEEKVTQNVRDTLIFKINVEQPNKLQESKIEYSSRFLAFTKKASVVNICKKFNQMVHDDLLRLKVKSRYTGNSRRRILSIVNVKCIGSFGKVHVAITADSISRHMVGQIGNYLLEKSYRFYVNEGNIKIKTKIEAASANPSKGTSDKGNEDLQICYHGNFCDFFGTPSTSKVYSQELKLSPVYKLQILYSFEQGQKLLELPVTKLNDQIFFDAKDSVSIQLKRAYVGVNNKSYRFRVSRGTFAYQSHSYRCNNSKIYFQESQRTILRVEGAEEINPIFVSAYSHDEQDKLLIYNGFINIKDVVGRGNYEIILLYEKEEKRKEIFFIMEITHSISYLSNQAAAALKLNKITANTNAPLFRTIYKHYLLIKINSYQYDIYECTINEQSLNFNATINIRKSDTITFELFSSFKAISKQLFHQTQKELIGFGRAIWQQLEQNGHFTLQYYPKKESQLKLTKNALIIQQKGYKLYLSYSTQVLKLEGRISGMKLKPNTTEVDVLNKGVINLQIKQFYPLEVESKIISIEIKPLNILLASQSHYEVNKSFLLKAENMQFELQAAITTKEGDKYKRTLSKAIVNLRGNHYRINQAASLIIYFENHFYLTAQFVIYHNKFVSIPQGRLIIRESATRGVKVDRFDLAFANKIESDQNLDMLLKRQGSQAKNCDLSIKTNGQMNGIVCNFQGKGYKIRERVCFSELNIDQYESEFAYERQILVGGESIILTLIVSYSCVNQVKQQQMSIKYLLNKSSSVQVQYRLQQHATLTKNRLKSQIPNKNQGFLVKLTIPADLAANTKQIHMFTENVDPIKLSPSVQNNQEFIYYSNRALQVRTLKLINKEFIDKLIEGLGKQNGVWKFMVDQNPKLICALTQVPCAIANIGTESWTFKFNFHRLWALNKKRLLSLKNTPNDDILTKQLGIVVKHGKQYRFMRDLDEFGSPRRVEDNSVEFGYDSTCNILEVFLIVDNYFNKLNPNFEELASNWMELFPIGYGMVNLSNVSPDAPFGLELQPLENHSLNLEKAINKMVIRSQGINCLCDISYSKKSWGFITLKLASCTAINFSNKQGQQIYIYFKLQVEDNNRAVISSFSTEARFAGKPESIEYTTNQVDFWFIQESVQNHYNLKVTGYVLDNINRYVFVEKKQDITDNLQKRGRQELNLQIKSAETNNVCKNTFQIILEMTNSMEPPIKQNLVQKAKSINTVDALSFREIGNIEFFERLLGCQQLSHFNECLQQIKQSFIYQQEAQYSSFIFLIEYLSFNFDANLVGQICEIIHLNLLKCPQIISELEEAGITKILYEYFKLICQRQRKKVPSKVGKVSNEEYLSQLSRFKADRNLSTLRAVLEKQAYLLYTAEQLLTSLSSRNNEIILNVINLLLKTSPQMKDSFSRDLDEWIEMFGFTTEQSQFELFLLVLKNCILYGSQLNQKSLHRLIDILLNRVYGLSTLYEFWSQLKDKNEQISIYYSVLTKYEKEVGSNCVQTCRGIKMMLSHISNPKDNDLVEQLSKSHLDLLKVLMVNLGKATDIILLSSHFDLLVYLFEQKLIADPLKNDINQLLKQKTAALKDNSSKMILNNYASKLKVKTVKLVNANKKQGLAEEMANKAGFYKKYLITSD